jgi:hypothetical protein
MTVTIQISDFRNNISNYINQMIDCQGIINLKRGKTVVAKVFPQVKVKGGKQINMAKNVLKDLESVRKKIGIKTEAKNMEELVNEIDRIVYGVDRNGRELSSG